MSTKKSNVVLGVLVGIGVGYVSGILTAQKPGKETREDIANFAKKTRDQIQDKVHAKHEDLVIAVRQAEDKLKSIKASSREGLRKAIDAAKKAKEQTKTVIAAMHRGTADDEDLQQAIDEANSALNHLKEYLNKDTDK